MEELQKYIDNCKNNSTEAIYNLEYTFLKEIVIDIKRVTEALG